MLINYKGKQSLRRENSPDVTLVLRSKAACQPRGPPAAMQEGKHRLTFVEFSTKSHHLGVTRREALQIQMEGDRVTGHDSPKVSRSRDKGDAEGLSLVGATREIALSLVMWDPGVNQRSRRGCQSFSW